MFQYDSALIVNMLYYIIDIFPKRKCMRTIVTKFGKFRYNWLPMVICTSGGFLKLKWTSSLEISSVLRFISVVYFYLERTNFLTIHGSISNKGSSFCKCLRFLKYGFAIFWIFCPPKNTSTLVRGSFHDNFPRFSGFVFFRKLARTKNQQGTDKASEHNRHTV